MKKAHWLVSEICDGIGFQSVIHDSGGWDKFSRMPSLHALECLVAVADSGSVTQAGELRGVKLTSAGRAAVADARRALSRRPSPR